MSGVFGVARHVFEHPLFQEPRQFSRLEAWLWLVREASWKERPVVGGVTLRRGQLCHSIRFIASAWGWQPARVQRFLDRLRSDTMIETASDTGRTVITLCNFSKWQRVALPVDTAADTPTESSPIQTIKKDNTSTYVEDAEVASPDFRQQLFSEGLASLRRQSGKTEKSCRTLLGRWLRTAGDDAAKVLTKVRQAEADNVADPVAWITAALKQQSEYDFIWRRGA